MFQATTQRLALAKEGISPYPLFLKLLDLHKSDFLCMVFVCVWLALSLSPSSLTEIFSLAIILLEAFM